MNAIKTIFELGVIGALVAYVFGALGVLSMGIVTLIMMVVLPVAATALVAWCMYEDYKVGEIVNEYLATAGKKGKVLSLYWQKNGRSFFRSDSKYIAGMYEIENEKKEEMLAFAKNDKGASKFKEAILEIFYDGANMALNPEYLLAIEVLKAMGYKTIQDLSEALKQKKFKPYSPQEIGVDIGIENQQVKSVHMVGEFQDGHVYVPLFKAANPYEIEGFVLGTAAIQKSYTDTKLVIERLKQLKSGFDNPNLQVMIVIIVVVIVVIIFGPSLMGGLGGIVKR